MDGREIIRVDNVSRTYRLGSTAVEALKGVSLTVREGEFVAIMGPSGSGKSTFLNLVGCLDRPTSGRYLLEGKDVATCSDDELADIRSRYVGFVFQSFNLLPRTNALENVELPLFYAGRDGVAERGLKMLQAVGLPERARHAPRELSGGEQQRVALARSLVNSPSLLLADEPTGNLDSRRGEEIMQMLCALNDAGITVVLVTHEHDIAAYAKRLVRFRDGAIVSDEPVERTAQALGAGVATELFGNNGQKKVARRRSIFSPGELWAHLRAALRSLWQNRMRALLTILGILIGVTAVIAMVSVGQGAQAQIAQRIEGLGSNLLTVVPGNMRTGGMGQGGQGSAVSLTYEDGEAMRNQVLGIAGVAAEMSTRAQVKYGRNNWNTTVTGTSADYPLVRNWNVAEGRFFTAEENDTRRAVCVLGSDVVTNLFGGEDPLGKNIKIQNSSFQVVGVLETRGGGGFFSQDDVVLVPVLTAMRRFTGRNQVRSIAVSVTNKADMALVQDDITQLMRERHRLAEGVDNDFQIMSQEDVLQTVQGVSQTMTLLLASIAGISLLVGGIGIMNIMLVSVTERTREIGIRKAVGARRRDILAQFLTEAIILSGTGGLLGWLFGTLGARLISIFGNMPTQVSLGTVGLALGFSVAVGLFFGIYPARKASKLDPIQALRYE
jgi:macrolide transport system ATP-binding/permease protein